MKNNQSLKALLAPFKVSFRHITKNNFLVFIFFLISILIGCGDDTTGVNYNIEPPRFNWRTVNFDYGSFDQIWAADTGNIYLLCRTGTNLFKLSGGNVLNYYIGNHYVKELSGINNNNIVVFALSSTNELKFIFFNGYSANEIPTGYHMPEFPGNVFSGFASINNGVWIYTAKKIISYNSGIIHFYTLDDTTMIPVKMFESGNNRIQCITQGKNSQALYELQDSIFVKTFEYSGNSTLKALKNIAYGYYNMENSPGPCFYNIIDSVLTENFCIKPSLQIGFGINFDGTDFNNICFKVYSPPLFNNEVGILHWNGNKISVEFGINITPFFWGASKIFCINENSFLSLEGDGINSCLKIGTRK